MSSVHLPHLACIGLGSNLGQSGLLLQQAWLTLAGHPDICLQKLSSPYRTKPVDMESPHWFVNAAGVLTTSMDPRALLVLLLQVEQQYGRVRTPQQPGHQDRTLDLDLLLFDEVMLDTPELILPHPAMDSRLFVLAPLAEIVPNLVPPGQSTSIAALCTSLYSAADPGDIEQLQWDDPGA